MIISRKDYYIPFLLLTFPVIIDAFNGYQILVNDGSAWVATIYKAIILIYTSKFIFKSQLGHIIKKILFVLLFCFTYQISFHGGAPISEWVKFIFPYFVAGYFLRPNNKYSSYIILRCVVLYGVIASIIIIICGITGFGYNPYDAVIGTRGLFKGGNEICLTMLLTNCLTIYMYQKYNHVIDLLFFFLISISCVIMATTAGIVGTIVIFIGFIITVFVVKISNYTPSFNIKLILLLILILVSYYVIDTLINAISEIDFLSRKFENISERFTESSGRKHLIDAAKITVMNFTPFDWFFGASNYYHKSIGGIVFDSRTLASAEVDWLDMIGEFGIIGAVTLAYKPIRETLTSIKYLITTKNLETFWLFGINLLFMVTAFYAGHAFMSMNAVLLLLLVNSLFLNID